MKKYLVAAGLTATVLLAACGNDGANGAEESTGNEGGDASADSIEVWAWDPNFNIAALEIAKEEYAEINPDVEVMINEFAQDDIIQKLNTGLSAGTGSGLPNIALIEDYRAQSFLQAYPDAFFPLTDFFNEEDFASYKIAPTSLEDEHYAMPFDTGVTGLYIRTDYLEEAGYDPADLQDLDWNEYIEIGRDIKEATGKQLLTVDPNDLGQIRMMIQTAGSWYLEEDGATPNLENNEDLKMAFEIYKTLVDEELGKPISDWSQYLAAFNSGEVASVPTGNWITPSVRAEESQSGNWTVLPFPKLPGADDAVNASNLGGSSWYVLNVDGKETAAEFLSETFGSSEALYEELITEVGALGTYLPAASSDAYQLEDEFFGGQQIISDFAEWSEQIPQVNFGLHTYSIEDVLAVEMQNYLNGKDIDDVLADAQKEAEARLN
ncbi:carbohydrate ABC transporter substrate-binding protein [Paenalkalicoccus suaedae]|uniref:Carbohydrate ABC transporter substrate-binding protein n=1 Tax=Paenalkalicoccus suaedae TaxID=2592382 RepID=A0A859FJ56_9BACI|nr:ABC transporter substrate-binding protein [Paenalkalicoccus suaedae]QKS72516.1 carbohydrate ABC transporter substrate-binding protein [Paenalkalicoccus suaedae]